MCDQNHLSQQQLLVSTYSLCLTVNAANIDQPICDGCDYKQPVINQPAILRCNVSVAGQEKSCIRIVISIGFRCDDDNQWELVRLDSLVLPAHCILSCMLKHITQHFQQTLTGFTLQRHMLIQAALNAAQDTNSAFLYALFGFVILLFAGYLLGISVLICLLVCKDTVDDCSCCHVRRAFKVPVAQSPALH